MKTIRAEEIIDALSDDFQDLLVREACVRHKEQALATALAEKRAQLAAQAQTRPSFLMFRKGAKEEFESAGARLQQEIAALEQALAHCATIQKKCSRIFEAELVRHLEEKSEAFRNAAAAQKLVPEWEAAAGLYRSCLKQLIMALGIARNQMASGYDRRGGAFAAGAVEAFAAAAAAARTLEGELAIPNRLAKRHRELLGLEALGAEFKGGGVGLPDLENRAPARDVAALKTMTLDAAQAKIGALLDACEREHQEGIPRLLEDLGRFRAAEEAGRGQLVMAPLAELRGMADGSVEPAQVETVFVAMAARFVHLTG